MNKRFLKGTAALLVSLTTLFSMGCTVPSLATPDSSSPDSVTETGGERDRMVGVYITKEHLNLFDMESYIKDNIGSVMGGDAVDEWDETKYGGRIYAHLTEKTMEGGVTIHHYEFPDLPIEGMLLGSFTVDMGDGTPYINFEADEGLSDRKSHLDTSDNGETTIQEATIYQHSGSIVYYFNPVYQTADGLVYLTEGEGVHVASGLGGTMTHTLKDSVTVTRDGESETVISEIVVTVAGVDLPESVLLLQMDENNREVGRMEIDPEAVPNEVTLAADTAYVLLVETFGGEVKRSLFEEGDDNPFVFRDIGDGICVKAFLQLMWQGTSAE